MTEAIVAEAAVKLGPPPKPAPLYPVKDKPETAMKSEPPAKTLSPAEAPKPTAEHAAAPPPSPVVVSHSHWGMRKQLAIAASALFSLVAGIAGLRLMLPSSNDDKAAPAPTQPLAGDRPQTSSGTDTPPAPPTQPSQTPGAPPVVPAPNLTPSPIPPAPITIPNFNAGLASSQSSSGSFFGIPIARLKQTSSPPLALGNQQALAIPPYGATPPASSPQPPLMPASPSSPPGGNQPAPSFNLPSPTMPSIPSSTYAPLVIPPPANIIPPAPATSLPAQPARTATSSSPYEPSVAPLIPSVDFAPSQPLAPTAPTQPKDDPFRATASQQPRPTSPVIASTSPGLPGTQVLTTIPTVEQVTPLAPRSPSATLAQGSLPSALPNMSSASALPSVIPVVAVEPPTNPAANAQQPSPATTVAPTIPVKPPVQGVALPTTTSVTQPTTTLPASPLPLPPATPLTQQPDNGPGALIPPALPDVGLNPKLPATPEAPGNHRSTIPNTGLNTLPDVKDTPGRPSTPPTTSVVPQVPVGLPTPPGNSSVPVAPSFETGRGSADGSPRSTLPTRPETTSAVIPVSNSAVASPQQRPPSTSFDEDLYQAKATDSWETISQEFYNSKAYASALKAYNRQTGANPTGTVNVPPIYILKQKYPGPARTANVSTPTPPASPPPTSAPAANWAPTTATTPASPSSDYKIYRVPPGGANMRTIARAVLGDDQKWGEIYNLNPWYSTKDTFAEGTEIRVPPNARLPN